MSVRVAVIPVPLTLMTSGTLGLLVVTVRDPVCSPVVVGEKARLKRVIAPAANVSGKVNPLTWYPDTLKLVPVTVTLREPVFFN